MAIDEATLRELKALDASAGGGLLDELVGLFASGTPERIGRLREAALTENGAALASEAHALKGSAGALGATSLLTLAASLEACAKAGDLSDALAQVDAIEAEFRSALGELEQEKARK